MSVKAARILSELEVRLLISRAIRPVKGSNVRAVSQGLEFRTSRSYGPETRPEIRTGKRQIRAASTK
jgi:hypothetical protein